MFTWRNPLGYLGFFAVLGLVGLARDISGFLGFFGFAYYFRYFWVLPDEMLLDYVRKSAAWGFLVGTGATLVVTLVRVFSTEPSRAFGFGMSLGFTASIIVFSLILTWYELRESRGDGA